MSKKTDSRQKKLANYYSKEILGILSRPMPEDLKVFPDKKSSGISSAEAKKILKQAIRLIGTVPLDFKDS